VYWTDAIDGTVSKVSTGGGAVTTLASAQPTPNFIAVDSNNVYWSNDDYGTISSVPVLGGTVTPLTPPFTTATSHPIAIDAVNVYWTDTISLVQSVPLSGSTAPNTLATIPTLNAITVDATSVYVSVFSPSAIMSVPLAGGTPAIVAASVETPNWLAVDSTNVYWSGNGPIMTAPKAGGGSIVTLAPGVVGVSPYVVVNSGFVYFVVPAAGAGVMKVPVGGGSTVTLTTAVSIGGGGPLAVDSTAVYWIDGSTPAAHSIMKIAK
jgi:hypothetical protein